MWDLQLTIHVSIAIVWWEWQLSHVSYQQVIGLTLHQLVKVRKRRILYFFITISLIVSHLFPSVIDCGPPEIPQNGYVTLPSGQTHLDDYVLYSCGTGYTLEGREQRACQENGLWSGDMPGCLGELNLFILTPGRRLISVDIKVSCD